MSHDHPHYYIVAYVNNKIIDSREVCEDDLDDVTIIRSPGQYITCLPIPTAIH